MMRMLYRWWRYVKLLMMPVILKPWRRSNLRFLSRNKVAHGLTGSIVIVLTISGLTFFLYLFQVKKKLEIWSCSFEDAFHKKDFDRAVEATQRMRYYERAVEETVKKLWSSIIIVKVGETWKFSVHSSHLHSEKSIYCDTFSWEDWYRVEGHFTRNSHNSKCIHGCPQRLKSR